MPLYTAIRTSILRKLQGTNEYPLQVPSEEWLFAKHHVFAFWYYLGPNVQTNCQNAEQVSESMKSTTVLLAFEPFRSKRYNPLAFLSSPATKTDTNDTNNTNNTTYANVRYACEPRIMDERFDKFAGNVSVVIYCIKRVMALLEPSKAFAAGPVLAEPDDRMLVRVVCASDLLLLGLYGRRATVVLAFRNDAFLLVQELAGGDFSGFDFEAFWAVAMLCNFLFVYFILMMGYGAVEG